MTTCVYHKPTKTVVADSRNTDSVDAKWYVDKIEHLTDGRVFLGSGHGHSINVTKQWAQNSFTEESRPTYEFFLEDTDDRDFTCLVISADGEEVWMADDELSPCIVLGDFYAIGSGAAYAIGALEAGADPVRAVEIACEHDPNTSGPIRTYTFQEG